MKSDAFLAVLIALANPDVPLSAQHVVQLPSLSIAGSRLSVASSYDSARNVYQYQYTVVAAPLNKANIKCFSVDLLGRISRPQVDLDLHENITRPSFQLQPGTTIPVGITIPDPGHSMVILGKKGGLSVCSKQGAWEVQPGTRAAGFVIESKLPPGIRKATLRPSRLKWQEIIQASNDDDDFVSQDGPGQNYTVTSTAVGPSDPDDATLFSGGGQNPAEVNKFLRYAAPTDSRVKVAAGTTSYTVIVFYGQTIIPSTFSATLNGSDVTSQFRPLPGSAQAITLPIGPGTTKLHLSVDGTKSSGQKATDSDTLTFLLP